MKSGRFILLLVGFFLIVGIYFLPRLKKQSNTSTESLMPTSSNFDIRAYINEAKSKLNEAQLSQLSEIEAQEKDSTKQKLALIQLAEIWAVAKQNTIAAYYSDQLAQILKSDSTWEAAGDDAYNAFKATQAPIEKQYLAQLAADNYKKALQTNSGNLDVKIKLASTLVEGTNAPMQGIQMLLQEVDKNPNNVKLNIALGQFAITSGQLEKALARFDKVISVEPNNNEAYYLKGETLRMMGKKAEALTALEKCKQLTTNPAIRSELELYIEKVKQEK